MAWIPELCYFKWDAILTTGKTLNDIKDIFIFVEDDSELLIEPILMAESSKKAAARRSARYLSSGGSKERRP